MCTAVASVKILYAVYLGCIGLGAKSVHPNVYEPLYDHRKHPATVNSRSIWCESPSIVFLLSYISLLLLIQVCRDGFRMPQVGCCRGPSP